MANIIKEHIKNRIRSTGTFRVIEIENRNLKNHLQKHTDHINGLKNQLQKHTDHINGLKNHLQKHTDHINGLKNHLHRLQNEKIELNRLIANLKAENKSLKQVYIETDIFSQDYNKLTIILPYGKTDDLEREMNLEITLSYLSKIGLKNLIISEHSNVSSKKVLMDNYEDLFDSFRVIFNSTNEGIFNKAYAINNGVLESKTPYFAIVDIDCLTEKKNIDLALHLLDSGFEVVHPFNRIIKDVVDKEKFIEEYDFQAVKSPPQNRDWADGGIVFWNKNAFIEYRHEERIFQGMGWRR